MPSKSILLVVVGDPKCRDAIAALRDILRSFITEHVLYLKPCSTAFDYAVAQT